MNKRIILSLTTSALIVGGSMVSASAFAGDIPGHPRVNEVEQRLDNQQERINAGEEKGQITPGQAARDEKRDEKVAQQLSKDEAKHNGHITKAEQHKLNKELNKNSHKIHAQRHGKKPVTPVNN